MIISDRKSILKYLYTDINANKAKRQIEYFKCWFDNLTHNPINAYLRLEDIIALHMLFIDPQFRDKPKSEKFEISDTILGDRGFIPYHSGTNRIVYRHHSEEFLLKIALDKVGIKDNRAEYINQYFLRPFVPRVFEVTPCGTVQMVEKVEPIQNRKEFYKVGGDVFDILHLYILGEFILEDIGTDFFMNWGVRRGFGPVLLDFPYLFKLLPERIKCVAVSANGSHCGGMIDYDDGMNTIICKKCGKRYAAKDLGIPITVQDIYADLNMKARKLTSYNPYDKVVIQKKTRSGRIIDIAPSSPIIPVDSSNAIMNQTKAKVESMPPAIEEMKGVDTPSKKSVQRASKSIIVKNYDKF